MQKMGTENITMEKILKLIERIGADKGGYWKIINEQK